MTYKDLSGKRVVVTTFASNVARLQTLGEVARETGRQLCIAGRSLDRIIEVDARRVGSTDHGDASQIHPFEQLGQHDGKIGRVFEYVLGDEKVERPLEG